MRAQIAKSIAIARGCYRQPEGGSRAEKRRWPYEGGGSAEGWRDASIGGPAPPPLPRNKENDNAPIR